MASTYRTPLLLVAAAAAVATALPTVALPPVFGGLRPYQPLPVGRPPLLLPPPPLHTAFVLVRSYPVPVPRPATSLGQTAITAASQNAVAKSRHTESATTMATTRAAVSPTTATDTTTRQQGLLSFINVPDIPCPEGQRRDPAGNCRDEW